MKNQDKRFQRYQDDAKFHRAVRVIESMIYDANFTHQDLQDAVFVAMCKFHQDNPVPLTAVSGPEEWAQQSNKTKEQER